ncbi:SHOCT domain-containing protein [Halorussus salinisoli]|uniref:SHOCT domain-containing protein n=1 Tax=Halorussus salinisoli TaxID=2558242 RepID=UPI0010C1A7F5|nr:SHOCT domain-containing protein [Halorussus salinisoli]
MSESSDSTFRALHRLVEHYTPDGTLGRILLGGTALVSGPFLFFVGVAGLGTAANFAAFLLALLASVLGIPAFVLGVLTLWPVYLSLIGNVGSPAAYPDGASKPRGGRESTEAVLKRRYAAGELSREEFERRLGDVMGIHRADGSEESKTGDDGDARLERSRSR